MKLLVAGSRLITNYKLVFSILDEFYEGHTGPLFLIVGGARGVDKAAELWAISRNIPHKVYEAKWETGGQDAGFDRNSDMVEDCDGAIIIWDGKSSGTQDTLLKCRASRKPVVEIVLPPDKLFRVEKPKVKPVQGTMNVMDFLKPR